MSGHYWFELGDWRCLVVSDGSRVAPATEIFPRVPPGALHEALRATGAASDDLVVSYNCLYVDTGQARVLFDTGRGQGALLSNLAAAGVAVDDIDLVVITHGDGDHVGGIGHFPRARFILARQSWELWTTPDGRQGLVDEFTEMFRDRLPADQLAQWGAGRAAYGETVLPSLAQRIELVEPEGEFLPGMRLAAAAGHRRDHTAVELRRGDAVLWHVADGIRHPIQIMNPDWTSYIDSYPERTAATNRALLARAARDNALIFGAHIAFPGLIRVSEAGAGWGWQEAHKGPPYG